VKKIYIAGPDVFYPDAEKIGENYKLLCAEHGFEGLFPLDNDVDVNMSDADRVIFKGNVEMIKSADIVIANLNSFRGAEPDSGTCFEVGLAYGLGKAIICYVAEDNSIAELVKRYYSDVEENDGVLYDKDGCFIEDFGNPVNLMLQYAGTVIIGDFEDCLKSLL